MTSSSSGPTSALVIAHLPPSSAGSPVAEGAVAEAAVAEAAVDEPAVAEAAAVAEGAVEEGHQLGAFGRGRELLGQAVGALVGGGRRGGRGRRAGGQDGPGEDDGAGGRDTARQTQQQLTTRQLAHAPISA